MQPSIDNSAKSNTTKKLLWQIISLSSPLILLNLSQTLIGVADTFFVSRISIDALAAVGLATIIYFAIFLFFRSTATSTVVFVGRAYGEKDDVKVGTAVWRSLNMIAWLSLFTLILPWFLGIMMHISTPQDSLEVRNLGTRYLQIRSLEIPFIMFSGVVWGFLVGRGDSKTPMILAWITVIINIFLDWVLVLGNLGLPQLGVAGAAYATVIANGINFIMSAFILWNRPNRQKYQTGKLHWASWSEIRAVLTIGLPIGLGDLVEIASFAAFFGLIARLGTNVLAANQIALQYVSIAFTMGLAINMATSSLVSQHLGAKRPDLAEKTGYWATGLAMLIMGLIGLSYLIAPQKLIAVFSEDTAVVAAGVTILKLVAFYQIFDALGIVLAGALNGAGDTRYTLMVKLLLAWGLFVPLVWYLSFPLNLGIWGAWVGALTYLVCLGLVYYWRFRSGKWKMIQLA